MGNGQIAWQSGQAYSEEGGVFACPDNLVQTQNEYAVREDLFPEINANAPNEISGPTDTMAQVASPGSLAMVVETGMQLGTPADNFNYTWATYQTMYCATGASGCTAANYDHYDLHTSQGWGNCDEYGNPWSGDWNNCFVTPRYKHASNTMTNILFADDHVKAVRAGNLSYVNNIFNPGTCASWGTTPSNSSCPQSVQ
jgi:hypothetical protein